MKKDKVTSFQDLGDKFGLQDPDLFRYLQIGNVLGKKKISEVPNISEDIFDIVKNAVKNI